MQHYRVSVAGPQPTRGPRSEGQVWISAAWVLLIATCGLALLGSAWVDGDEFEPPQQTQTATGQTPWPAAPDSGNAAGSNDAPRSQTPPSSGDAQPNSGDAQPSSDDAKPNPGDARPTAPAPGGAAEREEVTLLFTISNLGYIEPCG